MVDIAANKKTKVQVIGLHTGMYTDDPEATSAFIREIFDLEENHRVDLPHGPMIFNGNSQEHHIAVFAATAEPNPPVASIINQLSFRVPDEETFKEVKKRLDDRGEDIQEGPYLHRKSWPALPGDSGSLSMYFFAPGGFRIECYVAAEDLSEDIKDRYPISP